MMREGVPPPKLSLQDIVEFIFFPVVNEGCRVIDEGAWVRFEPGFNPRPCMGNGGLL